ncbi:MAG: hypothetical protein ABIR39_21435 [Nocardioides sp.]|uniref:hypothetical protein n=1 Tax=Nocardioides sp. TaxID=35761 RepID=UPI0032643C97
MIELRPTAMRATWTTYGEDAADEFRAARNDCDDAGAHDLDDASATVRDAASDMLGVLDVVLAVLEEHRVGMEECITDFENSDGNRAGEFNALTR